MKKLLLTSLAALAFAATAAAETQTLVTNGKTCTVTTLIDRDLGPGVRYTRLRLPEYPLNVNMLRVDITNPYNMMETTQANDRLYGTELLSNASKRLSQPGHQVLAGTNANFWCVSPQPPFSDLLIGYTYNGSVRNGATVSNINMYSDQWNGGYKHTGIVGVTPGPDKKAVSSNNWAWKGYATSDKFGTAEIINVNRTVRANELGMFNKYYGNTRTFKCVEQYGDENGTQHFREQDGVATEVYCTFDAGQEWSAGRDMTFTVMEIKHNAGKGTLGNYDLALVGRDAPAASLDKLAIGDKVTVRTSFIDPDGKEVEFLNLVGGNAQIMNNGELTKYATSESYNSMVYSRTCMGTDAGGTTLYMLVADKATDPFYGSSEGCPSSVICDIAKLYGCVNMTNFDAGGSAEFLVGDKIVNKTTESYPRAVANGFLAISTAPEDNVVTRLEFYEYELKAPVFASFSPRVIAYNKYGAVISDNFKGFTLSCPAEAGTCEADCFNAGPDGIESTLTATYGGVSVTKPIKIVSAPIGLRVKPTVVINHVRKPAMDITAEVDGLTYSYDLSKVDWEIADNTIAEISRDGILSGIKDGETELTARVGTFVDKATVKVQIAGSEILPLGGGTMVPDDWTVSCVSLTKSKVKLTPVEGSSDCAFGVDYSISATRAPSLTLACNEELYSLPEQFRLTINPGSAVISKISISLQPANTIKAVSIDKEVTLDANRDNVIDFDLSEIGDINDIAFYPISFSTVKFSFGNGKGDYHFDVRQIGGKHQYFTGIDDISADGTGDSSAHAILYNLQGMRVGANPAPGVYIRRQGSKSQKVIIR